MLRHWPCGFWRSGNRFNPPTPLAGVGSHPQFMLRMTGEGAGSAAAGV